MTTAGTILLLCALLFMLVGMPIAYALGAGSIAALMAGGSIPLTVVPQRIFTSVASFPLMAIIFFVIAGDLMLQGGISRRLVDLIRLFFGRLRGSLVIINYVACAFFGAISGSALATAAAIGGILYPEMSKEGQYDPDFAAATIGVGGTLGLMIPPAISLVIYGTVTGASVGKLFIAIVIPGILLTIAYSVVSVFITVKRGYAKTTSKEERVSAQEAGKILLGGIPALLAPVIVLGGIYSGIFTATESAIAASIYSIIVGVFVYRELTLEKAFKALTGSAVTSAVIMFLIGSASLFGWVMTAENIPAMVSKALLTLCHSKFTFLLLMNLLFFVAGMLMETSSIILLVVPLVYPVAESFGIDLVQFGVVTCTNLAMGMFTPPFGANIFLSASMFKRKVADVFRQAMPLIITGVIVCLLITYFPQLYMFTVK